MRFLQAGPWRLVPELFFLKSRAIILLTAMLLPCRILSPTISWTLQSRLPPAFASPTSPFLFLNTRSSNTSLPVGFPTTYVKITSALQEPPGLLRARLWCLSSSCRGGYEYCGPVMVTAVTALCGRPHLLPLTNQLACSKHP